MKTKTKKQERVDGMVARVKAARETIVSQAATWIDFAPAGALESISGQFARIIFREMGL